MTITELTDRIEHLRANRGDGCNQVADTRIRWDRKQVAELLRETFGCCGNRREVVAECTGEHGDTWTVCEVYCHHTGRPCEAARMGARTPSQEELIEWCCECERSGRQPKLAAQWEVYQLLKGLMQ